ncbi:hypothetical protein ACFYN0_24500 [Streptomyces sp. NPDC006704]|uniref:hypothetical protein n=1 Tax=Streptomyces sp. NPDC006704 TaxID=3364760 RepID=UPI00369B1FB5
MRGPLHRPAVVLAGLMTLGAAASGCGIRPTSVPVDAGPAPSRVACTVSQDALTPQFEGVTVQVYLVCGAQLVTAERSVRIPESKGAADRVRFAQALLDALIAPASGEEKDAGYTTALKGPLTVSAARPGDPAGTLRLSREPEALSAVALSQVVCTFAENTPAAPDAQQILLGGPGGDPARGYSCTSEMKSRPDSTATLGEIAPSPRARGSS